MKIGILGTRGIPNAYGGYEQFAERLSVGLHQRGHEMFVYNSSLHPYKEDQWHGVRIIHCSDWEDKLGAAGQFIYDWNCINDARKRGYDMLLQLGYTSNSIWFTRWPTTAINVINMDGLEWKRTQYSKLTRLFIKKAEAWAAKHGDGLIADSTEIQRHILQTYGKSSTYIPYGSDVFETPDAELLKKFHLQPQRYYLMVTRMEPENNIEMILRGYLNSNQEFPIIVIGSIRNKFGKRWSKKYSAPKIMFLDAIYDKNILNNLRFFSKLYFHGHSVGGTNPSLLEAMACRCNIAAHDNPFNRAVLGDAGSYFAHSTDVQNVLRASLNAAVLQHWQEKNLQKIQTLYTWQNVIDSHEKLFFDLLKRRSEKLPVPRGAAAK